MDEQERRPAAPARRRARRRTVTIREVARLSGVSAATVTRALQGHPRVLPETRQRVLDAVAQLGYRPDQAARTLATGMSRTIGLLIPAIGDEYWAEIAEGVEQRAAEREFSVIFGSGHGDPVRAAHMLDVFLGKRVDAIVFAAAAGADEVALAREVDVPAVFVGWDPPIPPALVERAPDGPPEPLARELARHVARLPYVAFDDLDAGELAAAHLARLGHTKLAFLGGPPTLATASRLVGGRIALAAAGLDFEHVATGADLYEDARIAALELLARTPRPTGIVAFNDLVAVGAVRAARQLGIRVPEELSIVGFDDVPLAALVEPPLTTVRQPKRELGAKAVDLLLEALENGGPAPAEHMGGTLVERGSTAAASPHVAA